MKKATDTLGVKVSATSYSQTLKTIFSWLENRQTNYVCVAAVHLVMECQRDVGLLTGVNKAGLIVPDGMPLVWLLKATGKNDVERVYGPDLMLKVCQQAAEERSSIFLLGGTSGQSKQLKTALQKKFPQIKIVGHVDTPLRPITKRKNQQIIKQINASRAQIIFVGLGCPHQERWMIDNLPNLKNGVAIGVGAAFDFITGSVKQAPRWLQNIGLEWLFRLAQEPRRLAYRYLVLNSLFILLVTKQFITNLFRK